ncbi:DUF3008 family protein [Thalassobaculum sp. OXR-137]|uniref:DUF3008 family protein n=1 Tax=Thalassobaculum sp. OXR-137 TaxID=3100173 RepID=UPI002AC92362|nr:DUF3008 family protein [Thalassobaculum sp. OXR-137]WPZ32218.1 DUF3008 family protein [Thalassobaculum sp. OXR-137]
MTGNSQDQEQAAAMALAAKRGEIAKDQLNDAARELYDTLSEAQLKGLSETDPKLKPENRS